MMLDAPEIQALVIGNPKCMEKLFEFVRREDGNETSAGYFSTVAQALLGRNSTAVTEFLFCTNDYRGDLVRAVKYRGVADFLWKLICSESSLIHYPYIKISLLQSLCDHLTSASPAISIFNTSRLLSDLLNYKDLKGWKVYAAAVMDRAGIWCETLKLTQTDTLICTFLRLLVSLLSPTTFASLCRLDLSEVYQSLSRLNMCPSQPAPSFHSALLSTLPWLTIYLHSSVSSLLSSLVIDLITCLVPWEQYEPKLISSGLLPAAVDLFAANLWSSIVHKSFQRLVETICDNGGSDTHHYLISTLQFPLTLTKIAANPYIISTTGKKTRKGSLGYVGIIGNLLVSSERVKDEMQGVEQMQWWRDFVDSFLQRKNRLEEGKLGDGATECIASPSPVSPLTSFSAALTTALLCLDTPDWDCDESYRPVEYWKLPVETHDQLADLE